MKPEELQIPAAFVTSYGIPDLNSNHSVMKQKSKDTSLVNEMITIIIIIMFLKD